MDPLPSLSIERLNMSSGRFVYPPQGRPLKSTQVPKYIAQGTGTILDLNSAVGEVGLRVDKDIIVSS